MDIEHLQIVLTTGILFVALINLVVVLIDKISQK